MRVCALCVPGAFCIPVYIPYNLTGRWMLGKGLCKVWLVMDYLLCSASVFNIVLISYDRFLSVTRAVSGPREPESHRNQTGLNKQGRSQRDGQGGECNPWHWVGHPQITEA